MQYFADGTRVTVTRTTRGGHYTATTGTIREHGPNGFSLLGTTGASSWFTDSAVLLRCYGVTQTITPVPSPVAAVPYPATTGRGWGTACPLCGLGGPTSWDRADAEAVAGASECAHPSLA